MEYIIGFCCLKVDLRENFNSLAYVAFEIILVGKASFLKVVYSLPRVEVFRECLSSKMFEQLEKNKLEKKS